MFADEGRVDERGSLTYWDRATHTCVGKLTIVGSDNGLSPGRRQAIIWTNAGILLIGPLGTNFSEILIGIQTSSSKKNAFENIVCEMAPMLSRPQWVNVTDRKVMPKGNQYKICAIEKVMNYGDISDQYHTFLITHCEVTIHRPIFSTNSYVRRRVCRKFTHHVFCRVTV